MTIWRSWVLGERFGGLSTGVASAVFASMAGICAYLAHHRDPELSGFFTAFIRIAVNAAMVIIPTFIQARSPSKVWSQLWGDRRLELWLWGFFGALTVTTFFWGIQLIGAGMTTLLQSTQGVWITLLSPWLLRQKVPPVAWVAVIGSMVGVVLLKLPDAEMGMSLGFWVALSCGVVASLAYLMIAKMGPKVSVATIGFYWSWMGMLFILLLMLITGSKVPTDPVVYVALLGTGLFATLSQFYIARAFQTSNAAMVAAVSYCSPVINLFVDVLIFGFAFTALGVSGSLIILVFGVLLPFLKRERNYVSSKSPSPMVG